MASRRKVRYAVIGLGWFAQAAILPAFANARDNSELVGLVTGDAEKARQLGKRYDVPVVGYEDEERFLASGEVDAVFIVTPNSEHREHTEKAARAGIHVLCEKPLAATSEDCRAMIDACQKADVRLMTAYRLHFEEGNLEAVRVIRSGKIGDARLFNSAFTMDVEEGNVRLDLDLGGGPIEDIGVYCINAARYLFRSEPTELMAFASWDRDEPRFREVPRSVSVQMRFPGERLANFVCGFGEAKVNHYRLIGTLGDLEMRDGYTWNGDITQVVTVEGKSEEATFAQRDQIAPEILYFSDCVLKGREPEPSGLEGLIDVQIIEAIRESYTSGGVVKLEKMPVKPRPSLAQEIERPANAEQPLVNASPPSA